MSTYIISSVSSDHGFMRIFSRICKFSFMGQIAFGKRKEKREKSIMNETVQNLVSQSRGLVIFQVKFAHFYSLTEDLFIKKGILTIKGRLCCTPRCFLFLKKVSSHAMSSISIGLFGLQQTPCCLILALQKLFSHDKIDTAPFTAVSQISTKFLPSLITVGSRLSWRNGLTCMTSIFFFLHVMPWQRLKPPTHTHKNCLDLLFHNSLKFESFQIQIG